MTRRTGLAAAVLLSAALTGCAAPAQPAAHQDAAQLPDGCLTATAGAVDKLWADIAATVPGAELTGHGVTRSDDQDLWFIAVRYDDAGTTFTGTWATVQDPTVEDDIAYVAVDDVAALSGTYLQPVEFRDVNIALIGADDCIR